MWLYNRIKGEAYSQGDAIMLYTMFITPTFLDWALTPRLHTGVYRIGTKGMEICQQIPFYKSIYNVWFGSTGITNKETASWF